MLIIYMLAESRAVRAMNETFKQKCILGERTGAHNLCSTSKESNMSDPNVSVCSFLWLHFLE